MDYINRLDNFDGPEIAAYCLEDEYRLYEEAFVIYKKKGMQSEAMEILLTYLKDIQRAAEFAEKVNIPNVWSKLASIYLENNRVVEAINCYLKS